MRYRRKSFRRKRHGANLVPLSLCSQTMFLENGDLCTNPTIEVVQFPVLAGNEEIVNASPQEIRNQALRKELLVQGMRFHWAVYPANTVAEFNQFFVSFRVAIVKMAVDAVGAPFLLPNLYSQAQIDQGDILWRGAGTIRWPVANTPGPFNCPDPCAADWYGGSGIASVTGSMSREGAHSPMEVVKTKRRLGPNEAIFWVINAHSPLDEEAGTLQIGYEFFGFAAVRSLQR